MAVRYEVLTQHLRDVGAAEITLAFGEIEAILGARLPDSARRHAAWWSNSPRNSYSRIWRGAGFRASASLSDELVQFHRGDAAPRPRWDVKEHLAALDASFGSCLATFAARRIFSGPSVYFYQEAVQLVRGAGSPSDLRSSDRLIELVYAALTSWGMHRMGESVATKLTDFPTFSAAVRGLIDLTTDLSNRRITELTEGEVGGMTARLAGLVGRSGISASKRASRRQREDAALSSPRSRPSHRPQVHRPVLLRAQPGHVAPQRP